MTITRFDRATAGAVRSEITAALAAIAGRHGVKLELGTIRFDHSTLRAQITGAVITTDGTAMTAEARDFVALAPFEGFEPADLGLKIELLDGTYRIVGYRARAPKRPIILERVGSKPRVVASAKMVLAAVELVRGRRPVDPRAATAARLARDVAP